MTPEPTPRPTVWVTPEPTKKPTNKPCPVLKCANPCPANKCYKDEECVVKKNYFDDDKRCPACDTSECKYVGWGAEKPLKGCAEYMAERNCNRDRSCTWKTGYPPLSFAEDADYQLLDDEESLFAVDGSVVEMINNMDSNMLMMFGVLFAAVLFFAMKQCLANKQKDVYTPINDEKQHASVAVVI